jgi:glucose/arabinose dehydrogenase
MVTLKCTSVLIPVLLCAGVVPREVSADPGHYRVVTLETPGGVDMEASGLALLPDGRLAVGLRKGEVWILDHPTAEPPLAERVGYHLFASGLHELLGLAWRDGALYATQRAEVTRLRDTDGDGSADEYLSVASGWGVSGAYHEYAYGPAFDASGNMYTSLNSSMGAKWKGAGVESVETKWRGWCMETGADGVTRPFAAGFRSPCGIGNNREGEVFVTDQQGTWFGTNPILHVRKGAFFGHAESLAFAREPGSPVVHPGKLPETMTVAEARSAVPGYTSPAVWLPYVKMGQSPTGLRFDETGGKFGPFGGQMFVGEFVYSGVNRVFLEKVGGEYQGACFPFIKELQSAVLSVNFLADGSMVVGQSNRGWNSFGNKSFGLQRIVWTGRAPFEVRQMQLLADGFRFLFTEPLASGVAPGPSDFGGQSYTYLYHSKYGSPEVGAEQLTVESVEVAADRTSVTVRCGRLREGHVHELFLPELISESGQKLLHRDAYYTLNRRVPSASR